MIFWGCAGVALAGAVAASLVGDIRRASLALWLAGLGAGGLYLDMGAELLAIIQWIVSTLVAISFIFYAVMFGEFQVERPKQLRWQDILREVARLVVPAMAGAAFVGVIWLGTSGLPILTAPTKEGFDLESLGRVIVEDHLLSLEILALTLFLVMVGAGVIARPEKPEESQRP